MPPLSSPSACFPFVQHAFSFGYSASCSSFQPSIGSASQGLSQRPDPFFRPDQIFPVPHAWFPVHVSRFCLFSFPVCSLSLFPASLPQPFHRCFGILRFLLLLFPIRPCVRSLRFHPGFLQSFRFAPVRLGLRYLVSVSSFPCFKLPPHSGFRSALHASLTLSGSFLASFSSFAPLPAVPFRFLWSASPRIRYSVPLLFLSPPHVFASQRLRRALAFPLGFRPSP